MVGFRNENSPFPTRKEAGIKEAASALAATIDGLQLPPKGGGHPVASQAGDDKVELALPTPGTTPQPKEAQNAEAALPNTPRPLSQASIIGRTLEGQPSLPAAEVIATIPPNWERYQILEMLGKGGMGAVYKAKDRRLGRIVALKFIRGEDPLLRQRLMQEARTQARIEHDNICKISAGYPSSLGMAGIC